MLNFNKLIKGFTSGISPKFRNSRCGIYGVYKTINQNELMNFLTDDVCILDVRTEKEFESIHLKNSINVPLNVLQNDISVIVPDKNTKILVYCLTGERTGAAIQKLNNMGYNNLFIWGNGGLNTLQVKELLE